ncbi:hypothetical protein Pcinc_039579 [Petrolisthes cinctipes]|uniref:Ionotropic glutamate receptor C-terminal domain-containing protein n=1 Tax=Petrolisthes cinctipes TaxID=88211 RepID=A0AAE1EIY4_PETCI|nr:hypothetical protein Pcinc_039579 [Petrolisthes cinctipes]
MEPPDEGHAGDDEGALATDLFTCSHSTQRFSRAPHFVVAAEPWPPHVYIHTSPSGTTTVAGPMGQLMQSLANSLNFTFSAVTTDGYWGALTENGTWNGMIGAVMRKEADIGLGPFGMSDIRSKVVDFTIPVFLEMLHVLVSRPVPQPNPWGFLAPFTWYTWVGVGGGLLATVGVSLGVVWVLGRGGPSHFTHHFWAFFSVSITQNLPWKPVGNSLRFTFLMWMMTAVVVVKSYSGSLTSLLAVKRIEVKYDSLRDVLNDPSLTLIMEGSTALTAHLKTVRAGVYLDLARASRERSVMVRASETYQAAYDLIPKGHHAMLVEKVVCRKVYSDHFSKTGGCDFYMSNGNFWRLIYAMVVQKGSPLSSLLSTRIRALNEFGIYGRWELDQMPNVSYCLKTPRTVKLQAPYSLTDLWV